MKYVRTFESFRNKNNKLVNEELLGGLMNFFKGLWNKATEELKKLGEDPKPEQIDEWIENQVFSPSSATYIFKGVVDEFAKKTEANNEDCLTYISNILDPETGVLGTQGLQPLYDGLLKAFGKNLAPLETIKFYLQTSRNRAIKDYKFAGGPELKIGEEAKIDPNAKKMDLSDTNHLPELKKILESAGEDNAKKKVDTENWVNKNLIPRLLKYIQEIKPEQVEEYLNSKGIKKKEGIGEIKEGDTVVYKRDKFIDTEWDKLTEDDKKKPEEGPMKELENKGMIGIKKVESINGEEIKFEGADFKKTKEDILMKVESNEAEESKKAAESLGKIKDDPEKMNLVADLADALQDDSKSDVVEEIKKKLSGES